MSDVKLLDGVGKWLETSGRALELRIAQRLRQAGAGPVQQSFIYTDHNTKVQREGDVLAVFPWTGAETVPCAIELVVECKSSIKHPWVVFYDQKVARSGSLDSWSYFAHGAFTSLLSPLEELWIGTEPFTVRQIGSHLATAHSDSANHAGDAVRQVLSAAEARRQTYLQRQGLDRRAVVIVPAVVTAAPLITCQLGADDAVFLTEVPWAVVQGHDANGKPCQVHVMNEEYVPNFGNALNQRVVEANEEARLRR